MEITGKPINRTLADYDSHAYELSILYIHIHNGFKALGGDNRVVGEKELTEYIMKESSGRFSPALVKKSLDTFKIKG